MGVDASTSASIGADDSQVPMADGEAAAGPEPVPWRDAGDAGPPYTDRLPALDVGVTGFEGGRLPPLSHGRSFGDCYEVVMVMDTREQMRGAGGAGAARGSRETHLRKLNAPLVTNGVAIEYAHLPAGDVLWVARRRSDGAVFVLDFILERKSISDMLHTFKSPRFKLQKHFLNRSGITKCISR